MKARKNLFRAAWIVCLVSLNSHALSAAEEPQAAEETRSWLPSRWSLPKPSLDSVTSWSDVCFFHSLRIQRHVSGAEYRLLDEDGDAQAKGSYDECLAKLEAIRREQNLEPMSGTGVVLLHGLAAPCWSMKALARYLRKHGDYEVFPVDYASLTSSIDDQAHALASIIQSLEGIQQIHLVGHSMGNIIIRRYLAGNDSPDHGWRPDRRIGRIVMIAPPNHGSIEATRLANNIVFKKVFGEAGQQLGVGWEELERRLATPKTEFGIIAGGMGNRVGFSPFILPGDDDGRITVETTRLEGASDFIVVSSLHETIGNDPRTFAYTLAFLTHGYFVSPTERQSIPRAPVAARPQLPVR
jgi:pimeloyl-ACP methyl ester carboxylesterase